MRTDSSTDRAAWSENRPISDPKVLAQVLNAAGFAGDKLLLDVTSGEKAEVSILLSSFLPSPYDKLTTYPQQSVKARLKANNDEAIKLGICGAPTYQIGDNLVWGQDRLNVVQDLVLGWRPEKSKLKASVSSYPHYDYRL